MVPNYPLSQKVLLLHQGAPGSVVVVCRREAVEGQSRGLRQELNHALQQQARQHDLNVILLHELVYSSKECKQMPDFIWVTENVRNSPVRIFEFISTSELEEF